MKNMILITCLCLSGLLLATSCGIHPVQLSAAETPSITLVADNIALETIHVHSTEPVVFEQDRSIYGDLLTMILEDGSYLDYNFESSWLAEGHIDVRFQYSHWLPGGFAYIYSYKAGEVNQFPILAHNGLSYDDVDVIDKGFSKGALTVDPETKEVFWAKQEFSVYQQWNFHDDGSLRLFCEGDELDGWMFYLDPEKGPCVSETEFTPIETNIWMANQHPDWNIVIPPLDHEALGLPVPDVYVPGPVLEVE